MKKALFVATIASHIKSFHIPYLKLLHDNGYKVFVAAKWNLNQQDKIEYCDEFIEIPIERSPYKATNIRAVKELRKTINNERFDIVHCHTPMGSVVTRLAARKARNDYNTKVIYTCHGYHFYKGAPIYNWLFFYPIEKWLSKYTDTIITINKEDYNLTKQKFVKRCSNIAYMPGVGIDNSKFDFNMTKNEIEKLREDLGILKDNFVIIYPARLCADKNQKLLIDLVNKCDDNNIKLLLPGRDEYNGFYQKYVSDNNIKNVLFLGERQDIPRLLRISDLLIATSIREGFGINIVEALASGLPVIAVDNRGHREIIEDGINGYIINNSLDELEEKFKILYENKKLYKNIKDNSYDSARKFFLDNSLKTIKKIYGVD